MSLATTTRLRDAIQHAVSAFRTPGAQVAWLSDGCIEQVEVGSAASDARFPLASVTKVFTATLAMQLVADGELTLDGPIGPSLPAGQARERLGEITLAQLLNHTSGVENDPGDGAVHESTLASVRAIAARPLLFRPGRHFSYANAGYVVVGHLIESATGLPWAEAMRSFLLEPLDVQATFTQTQAAPMTGHVRRRDGDLAPVAATRRGRGWAPASGLAVTASDLLRLMRLHLDDGRAPHGYALLPPSLVREMRARHVAVPNSAFADGWGLGFALNPGADGEVWFGHDGDGHGTTAYLRANADQGFAIAMVANCLPAQEEWRHLLRVLAASGVDVGEAALPALPARPVPIDPSVAGTYEHQAGRLFVRWQDGELVLRTSAQDRLRLLPVGGDRCLAIRDGLGGDSFLVAFLRDDEGCVQYLNVTGRVARRVLS